MFIESICGFGIDFVTFLRIHLLGTLRKFISYNDRWIKHKLFIVWHIVDSSQLIRVNLIVLEYHREYFNCMSKQVESTLQLYKILRDTIYSGNLSKIIKIMQLFLRDSPIKMKFHIGIDILGIVLLLMCKNHSKLLQFK